MDRIDCSTLEGKLRYIREKNPGVTGIEPLTLLVWQTFYDHLLRDLNGTEIVDLIDVLRLPSREQIAAARRRIEQPSFYAATAPMGEERWDQKL